MSGIVENSRHGQVSATEYQIHKLISEILKDSAVLGLGDDAAAIDVDGGTTVLISTDCSPVTTPLHTAKLIVIQNFSDIVCKGGTPLALLIGCVFPRPFPTEWFQEFLVALRRFSGAYGAHIVGGDTKEGVANVIVATALGTVRRDQFIPRFGAKAGDLIAVTLTQGIKMGWRWLKEVIDKGLLTDGHGMHDRAEEHYFSDWEIPWREMRQIASTSCVHSSMDTSDGIELCLQKMLIDQKLGAVLDTSALAKLVDKNISPAAKALGIPLFGFALTPGFNWEVIVSVELGAFPTVRDAARSAGGDLLAIGSVTDKHCSIELLQEGKKPILIQPLIPEAFLPNPREQIMGQWIARFRQ